MNARELSDAALLEQMERYLDYSSKPGSLDFCAWSSTKDFAPADREWLRAAVMGAQASMRRAS